MPAVHALRSAFFVCALAMGLVALPSTAQAQIQIPVPCGESSLVAATNTAVDGGGICTVNGTVTLTATSVTRNTASNSDAVNLLATALRGNTPDNCVPAGSVPGCAG
ncbi:hypothetical protein OG422_31620 (plasmid) [Streptomyces sp. NBC_01525]|uniref:hypothetical protein n=1 Tax=Streptomyces sp. NBC_01525 TaxID=2903893 RepID=UPI00386A657A